MVYVDGNAGPLTLELVGYTELVGSRTRRQCQATDRAGGAVDF